MQVTPELVSEFFEDLDSRELKLPPAKLKPKHAARM